MTVHMETVYAADKNVTSFDVSWNPTTVPWIVLMPRMSTSLDWTKPQHILFGEEFRRNQRKLGGRQRNHRTEYPRSPDISLNDVSLLP
jgi:hypothetical protein